MTEDIQDKYKIHYKNTTYLPWLVEIMFPLETTELTSIPRKYYYVKNIFVLIILFYLLHTFLLYLDFDINLIYNKGIYNNKNKAHIAWKSSFSIMYHFPSILTYTHITTHPNTSNKTFTLYDKLMKQNFIIFWRERVVNNSDDFVNNSDDLKKDLIICDFFQKKRNP